MAESNTGTILNGAKLKWAHFAWWAGLAVWTLSGGYDLWRLWSTLDITLHPLTFVAIIILDLFCLVFGIFLFKIKPKDWMAILVSMMFLKITSGSGIMWFWFGITTNSLGSFNSINTLSSTGEAFVFASAIASPFRFITQLITMYAFLIFPNGKWIFPRVRWLLVIWGILFFVTPSLVPLVNFDLSSLNYYCFMGIVAGLQILQYFKMPNSIQKQQIKWVVISFAAAVLATAIATLAYYWVVFNMPEALNGAINFLTLTGTLLNLVLVSAFAISIFRYRLWDTEILINRALVYSLLTGSLGLVGILSTTTLNYFIKQFFGKDETMWAVLISALPMAAVFTTLRGQLQKWVDRFFKPEEVNFENHFPEFRADVRNMLGTSQIVEIVSQQVKKQLKVEFARIYLLDAAGSLSSPVSVLEDGSSLFLPGEDALKKLMDGQLVVDDDGDPYSLLVPLVVTRPRFPDFLGVIVLGRRLSGVGYSTPILDSLKTLGANAGEAIYLSQLNEQSKQKVMA